MHRTRAAAPATPVTGRASILLLTLCLLEACGDTRSTAPGSAEVPPVAPEESTLVETSAVTTPDNATHTTSSSLAPGMESIGEATFNGLIELPSITLDAGEWQGEPYQPDAATRPRVKLVRDFRATGDLTGDGQDEAIVFLTVSTGGSGEFLHMAVMAFTDGVPVNLATEYVGDRVQIIDAGIDHDQIRMILVQAGPEDPACCPGEIGQLAWQWLPGEGLTALSIESYSERLSPDALGETRWLLRDWGDGEPASAEPALTLQHSQGQFLGSSGCNRYFAAVEAGERPGEIHLGPIGATRMACTEDLMQIEQRFLSSLGAVERFGFLHTRLLLTYRTDAGTGTLLFEAEPEVTED